MLFHHHVPAPPLLEHISMLWLAEMYATDHAAERLLPSGTMELIVDLRTDIGSGMPALMVGAKSQPSLLDTSHAISVIGAHFRPGGAFAFVSVPVSELHNQDVDLSDIWTPLEAREVRERLLAAATPAEKFALFERALLARLSGARASHRAVKYAIAAFRHAKTVGAVVDEIGLSQRSFINAFAREVGMTPKLYSRVRRFQRALRMVHGREDVDWSGVALACGYFDQPHLIRDFRAFSGLSPSAYLDLRTDHLNHVPIA